MKKGLSVLRGLVPVFVLLACLGMPHLAHAQAVSIDLGQNGASGGAGTTSRLVQLTALITVLSLAPSLLVMITAFTRIVIVLSLLRSALGAQGTPPNTVLIGLALFLTLFVMQPTLQKSWDAGIEPLMAGRVGEMEGLTAAAQPFHDFMAVTARPA
ncbi:MAG: flagellar biosynthetic protein FliP, partial [Gluconobacter oxydans]